MIRLCIFLEIVGNGNYMRTAEGVEALTEDEICEGLWLAKVEAAQ